MAGVAEARRDAGVYEKGLSASPPEDLTCFRFGPLWSLSADLLHNLPVRCEQRVSSECQPDEFAPASTSRPWAPFLSQVSSENFVFPAFAAWRQQTKVVDPMPIAIWYVIAPSADKLVRRAFLYQPLLTLRVFVPESDRLAIVGQDPTLGDWRPPQVAGHVFDQGAYRRALPDPPVPPPAAVLFKERPQFVLWPG